MGSSIRPAYRARSSALSRPECALPLASRTGVARNFSICARPLGRDRTRCARPGCLPRDFRRCPPQRSARPAALPRPGSSDALRAALPAGRARRSSATAPGSAARACRGRPAGRDTWESRPPRASAPEPPRHRSAGCRSAPAAGTRRRAPPAPLRAAGHRRGCGRGPGSSSARSSRKLAPFPVPRLRRSCPGRPRRSGSGPHRQARSCEARAPAGRGPWRRRRPRRFRRLRVSARRSGSQGSVRR